MRTLLTILIAGSMAAHMPENTSDILQHVRFQSRNLENILTWDSGPRAAPDTVYSVEYKTYGEKDWLAKKDCQQITHKFCNLTMETTNSGEVYYARVTATSAGGQSATQMSERFCVKYHAAIKPPDVTCIPKMRSIQMIVHRSPTPIQAIDGHQLTLEDIFPELSYRLRLQSKDTTQMVNLEVKEREHEFTNLTPDTEFLGTTKIWLPSWFKESTPYECRVKTLPDQRWAYSFSGALLLLMGLLLAGFCCLSYRYFTRLPPAPNSMKIHHMLPFQPLQLTQEDHMFIPVFELSSPSGVAQTVQYSQAVVQGPKELPGAPPTHSPPGITHLGQLDITEQPSEAPPHQTLPPLSYVPQVATEITSPPYAPQESAEATPRLYTPQGVSEAQPRSFAPHADQDSLPCSYGMWMYMEGDGRDSPAVTPSSPEHRRPRGQLQKEAPGGNRMPGAFLLQEATSLATEEPQGTKCLHQHPGIHRDPNVLHRGDPGTPGYTAQLPLLSSLQIEGHPVSLPCIPRDQGLSPWGLLESLVFPKDEGPPSETKATPRATEASQLEQPPELDSFFRDLALTVQWEP
ncbi:PREDICTED: interleukin-22 receptor subunit alpha-1 [Condylura cristata]|uniref:interleukin-22 receptor subunit alpha-1 n=1 Tax=Condylura cristata TaxID=143302 RepID=UPI0003345B35|nr:PREDICTED: interleukin-22 receptor subunit alpha-1 [Condylura cristata]